LSLAKIENKKTGGYYSYQLIFLFWGDKIITLYGKYWYIEANLQTVKSFLRLTREFRIRSYNELITQTSTIFIIYIMLAVVNWRNQDPRTLKSSFTSAMMRFRITFMETLTLPLELLKSTMKNVFSHSKKIKKIPSYFVNSLSAWLKEKVLL